MSRRKFIESRVSFFEQPDIIEKQVENFGNRLKERRRSELKTKESDECETANEISEPSVLRNYINHCATLEQMEDIFGLNEFVIDNEDNFIVESYNRDGDELIFTILEIKRHTKVRETVVDSAKAEYETEDEVVVEVTEESDESSVETDGAEKDSNESDEETSATSCESLATPEESVGVVFDTTEKLQEYLKRASFNISQKSNDARNQNDLIKKDENYKTLPKDYKISTSDAEEREQEEETQNENKDECGTIQIRDPQNISNKKLQKSFSTSGTTEVSNKKPKKTLILYIIEELIKTEEQYIRSLEKVVTKYVKYVKDNTPNYLIGKDTYIFGNIEEIYRAAKQFWSQLKQCDNNYEAIAKVFLKTDIFKHYPEYSKNKPTADIYIKEFEAILKKRQAELNDKLDLNSYLLTPIQRLGKYVLMFENLEKELKKTNQPLKDVVSVIQKIKNVMRKGNDYIAIDSIKRSAINLFEQGSFIEREKFTLIKPRKMESMLFLFEQVIVFTQVSSVNLEHFTYFNCISFKDLTIAVREEHELQFDLWNYTEKKNRKNYIPYVIEAKTPKIKENWVKLIQSRLWSQFQKVKQLHERDVVGTRIPQPLKRAAPPPPRHNSLRTNSTFYVNSDK